jgi:hypothetical protein
MGCHGAYLKAMELKHAFCGVFRTTGTLCIRQCVHVMCIIADYLHCFVIGKVLQFVYQFVAKQEAHQPCVTKLKICTWLLPTLNEHGAMKTCPLLLKLLHHVGRM